MATKAHESRGVERRWIIENNHRRCPRWGCPGKVVAKVTDAVKGTIHRRCRECGHEEDTQATDFFSRRPCKHCKWFRNVRVRLWSGRQGEPPKENFEEYCDVCRLETSARVHYRTAMEFFARVKKSREMRRQKIQADTKEENDRAC